MNSNIVIDLENKKVQISDSIKQKIKELILKDSFRLTESEAIKLDDNIVDYSDFSERFDQIVNLTILVSEVHLRNDNHLNLVDKELYYKLINLCNIFTGFYQNNLEYHNDDYRSNGFIYDKDPNEIERIINLVYEINSIEKEMYLLRDLTNYKDDCIINMKYFMSNEDIEKFEIEYDKAIKENNINKLKSMLNNIQQLILKEWNDYFDDLENMKDDKFCFIGHSTNSVKFNNEFYSKYVSCSLYDQDINDTFNLSYGFIMGPNNIVGAMTKDMYVKNYVYDDDNILNYSSFPKIYHPTRMLEECKKLKEENPKCKIYNEVVKKGFEPIGLFCFTVGDKEFDDNYRYVSILQKCFPDLKIYSFDKFRVKQDDDNKLIFINNLQRKLSKFDFKIDLENLDRYNYFFEKYDILIKQEYEKEDVEKIFKKNLDLLSILDKWPDNLFNNYDDEEIKYILGYNVKYDIENILKGNINAYSLTKLNELYPYKEKLDKYYGGLKDLVSLVSKIEINDEIVKKIKKLNPLNLNSINNYLSNKILPSLTSKKTILEEELKALKNNYQQLLNEQKRLKNNKEKYDYYYKIKLNSWTFEYIKRDYDELLKNINDDLVEEKGILLELEDLNKIVIELNNKKNYYINQEYNDEDEQRNIEIKQEEKDLLNKHPFINRKKIKRITEEINFLDNSKNSKKEKFDLNKQTIISNTNIEISNIEFKIKDLKNRLEIISSNKQNYQEEMKNITKKINEDFDCNSIDEIEDKIKVATNFIDNYDNFSYINLIDIESEIKKLTNDLNDKKVELTNVNTEISNIRLR